MIERVPMVLRHELFDTGDRSIVSYQELQAADNLARFACAVYAVAPVAENQYVLCLGALSLLPA